MRFILSISMNSAAFEEQPGYELARILRALADRLEDEELRPDFSCTIRDVNGNRVGTAQIEE